VMLMWTDMRCPYCGVFSRKVLPQLMREYVDTGKVRIEVHDVAMFGAKSHTAAVAAHAAAEQGKFHEYISALYADAPEKKKPDLPRAKLVAFAKQAGVADMARFEEDMDSAELSAAAKASDGLAQQVGVTSVPFFVVNRIAVAGAQPVYVFQKLLDEEIAKADA
ncbi:MAG: thioredoxin domain-containing protein, partial [Gaiellales bacterium]